MGVRNLAAFNAGLDRFAKKIEVRGVLFQKKVAFMLLGAYVQSGAGLTAVVGVLQLTPVDTGRAVGNWQVSIGSPVSGEIDAGKPNKSSGKSVSIVGRNRAISDAMRRATPKLSGLRLGQSIWIVNNVAYIVVLNDGGPNRTAHHMLERAVGNTRRALRSGGA